MAGKGRDAIEPAADRRVVDFHRQKARRQLVRFRSLQRAQQPPEAHELAARFLPMEINYPAIGRWLDRVAALPGHERTWPPHWR